MNVESFWGDLLIGDDKEVLRQGGFGKPRGLGERPALLVIDPQMNYMGDRVPILDQLKEFPTGCGEKSWQALENSLPVLSKFREAKLPVIFSRNVAKYLSFDNFATKSTRDRSNYVEGHPYTELVPEVNLQPNEFVVDKGYASVFQGTPLVNYLNRLKVDTLIVCGGVTSGCVRSTVVDAASLNYHVAVLYDCVFDRVELSHRVGLLDMWMKYADLINTQDALHYIEGMNAR
jgi:maleamate amidohydrolase